MKTLIGTLLTLIDNAKILGLPENDLNNAYDFLEHHEFLLCFDTILTQLYEHDIEIDNEFYKLVDKISSIMSLPIDDFIFIKELLRNESPLNCP